MGTKDCSQRTFKALMTTQFLGAINDNIFQLVVSLLILQIVTSENEIIYLSASQALFVVPFILFSAAAGYLADKYRKSTIIKATKLMEIVVMGVGCTLLLTGAIDALLVVLFFMGLQSTLFSPNKYGILPEMLEHKHLSKGNGYLEFWTFMAILSGTIIGSSIMALEAGSRVVAGATVAGIALVGFASSCFIKDSPVTAQSPAFMINPFRKVVEDVLEIRRSRGLFLTLLAITYFWFVGAWFRINILLYADNTLGLTESGTGILLAIFTIGIGAGSLLAGAVSAGKVELGLVPLGAVGISVAAILLGVSYDSLALTCVALILLGVSAGVYVVPLNAYFQQYSPPDRRGRYLASSNVLCFSGMLLAYLFMGFFGKGLDFSPAQVFIVVGLFSIVATFYALQTLPEMFVRCLNWLITHTLYRVRVLGKDNLPEQGGALLVCNHTAYVDPSIISAVVERHIRFLMYRPIYEKPLINLVARTMRAIPIANTDDPKEILKSLGVAREAVQSGELVCIFAEGELTRTGHMVSFKKGLERIMKGVDAPIIPIYLDQIWGSVFSFEHGRFFWKRPKEIPYPVTISFGTPLAGDSRSWQIRQAIQDLSSTLYPYRASADRLLHTEFIRTCKKYRSRTCFIDSTGKSLTYGRALVLSLTLAERFKVDPQEDKMVGILLPPSVAAAISNVSLLLGGLVPVNLNYTVSEESLKSAISQCGMQKIITAPEILEKLGIEKNPKMMFFEDLLNDIKFVKKLKYYLIVRFIPTSILEYRYAQAGFSEQNRLSIVSLIWVQLVAWFLPGSVKNTLFSELKPSPDSLATVIFSSGSTGEPKGIMLSHANILSNLEALFDVFQLRKEDTVLGVLPFFHSFGFTGTLWMPILAGMKAVYHSNPMDAKVIGELSEKYEATILLGTPTFLLSYVRKCTREQFAKLKYVVVGAEKLKDRVAKAFKDKFGIQPLEGYGCTELSPIAVLNIPDYEDSEVSQVGQKAGSVGHPLPGVSAKIVDPASSEPLSPGEEGMLLVKGPNVMLGYLENEDKTSEVIKDGWYVTGDIAKLDDDGFVTITDRISRFSKIGGEMVPHVKIEEEIQNALDETEQICVVTSVPDERKGERLIVLYTRDIDLDLVVQKLSESGLPNLWIPKKDNFYRVEALPLLGSGKLDLKGIKDLAVKLAG
jgi:acyl-[acyl-carrier-protein]-phospholipid O-acyltransferase / long-chain-fatty-acid--[acyl-carrier-protein] ligase